MMFHKYSSNKSFCTRRVVCCFKLKEDEQMVNINLLLVCHHFGFNNLQTSTFPLLLTTKYPTPRPSQAIHNSDLKPVLIALLVASSQLKLE